MTEFKSKIQNKFTLIDPDTLSHLELGRFNIQGGKLENLITDIFN